MAKRKPAKEKAFKKKTLPFEIEEGELNDPSNPMTKNNLKGKGLYF